MSPKTTGAGVLPQSTGPARTVQAIYISRQIVLDEMLATSQVFDIEVVTQTCNQ